MVEKEGWKGVRPSETENERGGMNSRPAASGRKRAGEGERGRICRPLDTDEETPTPIDSDDLGILPCPPAIAYRSTRGLPSFSLPPFILSWRLAPAMFLLVVFRPTFKPSSSVVIRVLSFVRFLFSRRPSRSQSGRSARFFVSLYSFRALFIGFICC